MTMPRLTNVNCPMHICILKDEPSLATGNTSLYSEEGGRREYTDD